MLKAVLERLDDMLMYSAVRQGWEAKDKHDRIIESVVGEIFFKRRYYRRLTLR
ncbi:MAG: UPF0236 family transposase-like protein [Eubacteriales bacterium]